MIPSNFEISIAPMMKCTDRHFRYLARILSKNIKLYTEMLVIDAIIHNRHDLNSREFFKHNAKIEHPLAIQLGGSNPKKYKEVTKILNDYEFAEINLNIGCPSDRVTAGKIGACLMSEPNLVADCVNIIKENLNKNIPVTIKTRIGIDEFDSYEFLENFVKTTLEAKCDGYIIHARKAWLKGLSPRQNRTVPKINYNRVYELKENFKDLKIILNGEVKTICEIIEHNKIVDGVMLGRSIYSNPYYLGLIEKEFFNKDFIIPSREVVLKEMLAYLNTEKNQKRNISRIIKHLYALYFNEPNAKQFREMLTKMKLDIS